MERAKDSPPTSQLEGAPSGVVEPIAEFPHNQVE